MLRDSDTIIRWWRGLDPARQEKIKSRVEEFSHICALIEEGSVVTYPTANQPPFQSRLATIPSPSRTRKAPFFVLGLALVAAIIYGFAITGDRDAIDTKLKSVQQAVASTTTELNRVNGTLASVQSELSATKQILTSTQTQLSSTRQSLTSTQSELVSTKQTLSSTQSELSSSKQSLTFAQGELKKAEAKLQLYAETMGIEIVSNTKQIVEKAGYGSVTINLTDNPSAVNPSWDRLKAFLLADPTDDKTYIKDIFDCSQFAEMLHNNAEAAGIKSAYVQLGFKNEVVGHALNVFKTTDQGLVYVDSTGRGLQILRIGQQASEQDKIAYVVKSKEFGAISLGKNTPIDYASYEKMKLDWDSYYQKLEAYNNDMKAYNNDVKAFNNEIFLNTYYIGTPAWSRIKEWESRLKEWESRLNGQKRVLDSLRAQMEPVWNPMGIVERIRIFWGG